MAIMAPKLELRTPRGHRVGERLPEGNWNLQQIEFLLQWLELWYFKIAASIRFLDCTN